MAIRDLLFFTGLIATFVAAGCSKSVSNSASNYDDCLLAHVNSDTNITVVHTIEAACRNKYPPKWLSLPSSAISKLTGTFDAPNGVGNIYNGNDNWTVSEITIEIWNPGTGGEGIFSDLIPKQTSVPAKAKRQELYNVELQLPPYSYTKFFIETNDWRNEDYLWTIVSARGTRK